MDKNKIVIMILILVIVALSIVLFATMNGHAKENTELTIIANSSIYEGDSIKVKLTDLNGTPIANQTINVTIIGDVKSVNYNPVVSDSDGIAELSLNESAGNYTINCSYGGNDKYVGSTASKAITIIEEVIEESYTPQTNSYSDSYSSQQSSDDSRPAVDSSGITREEADYYGWEYTSDHGGHYIGSNDAWDEEAGVYHD